MKEYERLTREYQFDCSRCEDRNCTKDGFCCDETFCKTYNRLAELEDKIENCTLIELPCKVGDAVWCIYRYEDCFGRITDYFIEQDKAQCFIFDEGKFKIFPSNYNNRSEYYYKLKDIFLTKAEAENKLKELKEMQGK